jgi:Tol biopolymer transport system component
LANNNNLFAIQFDLDKQSVAGGPVAIVEGVFSTSGAMQYAISESGTLVYMPGTSSAATAFGRTLMWVDRGGKEQALHTPPDNYQTPKISPDGKSIAYVLSRWKEHRIWGGSGGGVSAPELTP